IPAAEEPQPVAGRNRYKALLVEDNRALRELLCEIFAPHYDVTTAENGVEALEAMRHELPDIIVSDIVMPRMDGFELCKAVKTNFDTSHIPFVALTAYASIENNLRGYQTGADDYVTKPFNAAVLLARCNNLINSRIVLQKKFRDQQHVEPENLAYTPLDQAFIEQAMKIIDRHIRDPKFNIDTFAKEMCIARTKLFVKLKTISGQTPSEFIMTIKLRRAADLLLNRPEYNVSDICELLGFNTLRYFSKCFKDKYRISPLRYRRNRGRIDPE
ncbi:MAG: response regulator, partial [Alistipes sp.]|nr:response regulator [Alistipes sp.]